MDDSYVVDWGLDGTGYLRPVGFGLPAPPSPPPEPPPPPPSIEEVAHGADDPWAYGQAAGPTGP